MADNGARIPKVVEGAAAKNLATMPLSSIDGYVMSRIDGATSERDLVASLGLPEETIDEALGKLEFLGLIAYTAPPPPPPRRTPPPPRQPPRAQPRPAPSQRPPRGRTDSVLVPPPGGAWTQKDLDEPAEIEREHKKKILELYHRLHALNHYEVLGVPRGADKKVVKRAYFDLAGLFHPDRFFRKELGTFKVKMEACFARISQAHDVLTSKKRGEYDQYLGDVSVTQTIERQIQETSDLEMKIVEQARKDDAQLVLVTERMELKLREQARPKPMPLSSGAPPPPKESPAAAAAPKGIEELLQEALAQLGAGDAALDAPLGIGGGWDAEAETSAATGLPPPPSDRTAGSGARTAEAARASQPPPRAAARPASPPASADHAPPRAPAMPPPRVGVPPPPPSSAADFGQVRPLSRPPAAPSANALQREALARRLLGGRAGPPRRAAPAHAPAISGAIPSAHQMSTADAMAAVRRMYEDRVLGGRRKQAAQHIEAARKAVAAGDPVAAVNAFRLAITLDPHDKTLQQELDAAQVAADGILAETYQRQATYEEKNESWKEASRSWAKVAKTRPDNAHAHDRAAFCAMKANGDMHEAAQLASRAVTLDGENAEYRVTLAQVYLAAGLPKNAKRELDAADKMKPKDPVIQALLKRATTGT